MMAMSFNSLTRAVMSHPGCGVGPVGTARRSQWSRSAEARSRNLAGVAPNARTRNSGVPISPSVFARSRKSANHSSHWSPNNLSASVPSRRSNAGGSPAWSGWVASSRRQKAWIVSMAAPSRSPSASSQRFRSAGSPSSSALAVSRALRTRSRSSEAAASLKVIAAILVARTRPVASKRTMRPTNDWVLPVPGPASTNSVRSRSLAIMLRASWSTSGSMVMPLSPRFQAPSR